MLPDIAYMDPMGITPFLFIYPLFIFVSRIIVISTKTGMTGRHFAGNLAGNQVVLMQTC